jgi:hypothetical protein
MLLQLEKFTVFLEKKTDLCNGKKLISQGNRNRFLMSTNFIVSTIDLLQSSIFDFIKE